MQFSSMNTSTIRSTTNIEYIGVQFILNIYFALRSILCFIFDTLYDKYT